MNVPCIATDAQGEPTESRIASNIYRSPSRKEAAPEKKITNILFLFFFVLEISILLKMEANALREM